MIKPFDYIQDSSAYQLKYNNQYNNGQNSIAKCITDTATYYDQHKIEVAEFKRMIDKITQGSSTSILAYRNCVSLTVQAICIYFPSHLTVTNVTNLIKCFRSTDTLAVEYIQDTGYEFTSAQYKALNKIGIIMLDKKNNMTLQEFYSLLTNETFKKKIDKNWDVDPSLYDTIITETVKTESQLHTQTEAYVKDKNNSERESKTEQNENPEEIKKNSSKIIYPQYIELKAIIEKFNIKLDSEFWTYMILVARTTLPYSRSHFKIRSLLNLHRIIIALGCEPQKQILNQIIETYEITTDNYNEETNSYFDEILQFYSNLSFDRSDIITYNSSNKFSNIKLILDSKFCSYDPMIDLYYWMNKSCIMMKNYLIFRIINNRDQDLYMHLVSLGHITSNHFKNYIETYPECGWDDETFIRITISFVHSLDMIEYYVDNKLIINLNILDYMRSTEAINRIYKTCTSYDEKAFNRILDLRHEKLESSQDKRVIGSYSNKYRIYRSMSPRDRKIMTDYEMMKMFACPLVEITLILRYDIHITREHLEYILSSGYEELAIALIHISKKYYYLIDYIDLDMTFKCYNYLPRMWIYRNIIIPKMVDSIKTSEFTFCLYDKSEKFIFDVKMNDEEDSDLSIDIKDRIEEIAEVYHEGIQGVQESALNRILGGTFN